MARRNAMISRRWLVNYVLIILIVIFTYIGNKYNVQTGYQPDNRITRLKAADIIRIDIQTADITVHLSKQGSRWRIDSPLRWYANNVAVERIIDIVNAQTDSKLASSEIDLATLGLQFPKAVLKLNDVQISFGATNNIGERRYLLIDDTVYLLKDRYLPFVTQGITGLLDRRLLPAALPVKSMHFPDFKIHQLDDGNWRSDSAELNDVEVNQVIDSWQSLQADRIHRYRRSLTPKQKITATLDDGAKIEFHVLSITPHLVISRTDLDLEYHFREESYYGLLAARKDENTVR